MNDYYVTNDYITQKSLYNLYGKKFQQWWSTIQLIQHEQPPPVSIYDIWRWTSNSWVPLVEQELLALPEHLSSPPVFSGGVRVTRYLVLCVCFVDSCFSFCHFSFGHCVVCSTSIYRFWLPLWNRQALLGTGTKIGAVVDQVNSISNCNTDIVQ